MMDEIRINKAIEELVKICKKLKQNTSDKATVIKLIKRGYFLFEKYELWCLEEEMQCLDGDFLNYNR